MSRPPHGLGALPTPTTSSSPTRPGGCSSTPRSGGTEQPTAAGRDPRRRLARHDGFGGRDAPAARLLEQAAVAALVTENHGKYEGRHPSTTRARRARRRRLRALRIQREAAAAAERPARRSGGRARRADPRGRVRRRPPLPRAQRRRGDRVRRRARRRRRPRPGRGAALADDRRRLRQRQDGSDRALQVGRRRPRRRAHSRRPALLVDRRPQNPPQRPAHPDTANRLRHHLRLLNRRHHGRP